MSLTEVSTLPSFAVELSWKCFIELLKISIAWVAVHLLGCDGQRKVREKEIFSK